MSKVIIYDYEVFKYDTLFGCIIIDENNKEIVYQTWSLEKIKQFYNEHKRDLYVGHNNFSYDDKIHDAIVFDENPYTVSKKIVNNEVVRNPRIDIYSVDLMKLYTEPYSLKVTELLCGKSIDTTEVSFDIDRKLTEEEKKAEERYNYSDLDQTKFNYNAFIDLIKLRFDIIKEFGVDPKEGFKSSISVLAEKIFKVKPNKALKLKPYPPTMYSNLILDNKEVLDFYLKEKFRNNGEPTLDINDSGMELGNVNNPVVNINGFDITLGKGGGHGALKNYFSKHVLYVDVKGYYNLIALLYDLLPRNFTKAQKEQYNSMYKTQLALKDINPRKRQAYKVLLLAIIGSMNREGSAFYDPNAYDLIGITGQLFIIDLIEKLHPLVKMVQLNTDGIMFELLNWNDEDKVKAIINRWTNRTGFEVKIDHLYNLWQRDVNTYCCKDKNGKIIVKGNDFKNYYYNLDAYSNFDLLNNVEPSIIAKGVVDYLINDITPEETVEANKKRLVLFQYICKKGSFDFLVYECADLVNMEHFNERIQDPSRAFASRANELVGTVKKCKDNKYGKSKTQKLPNLPDNVFIYNADLTNAYDEIGEIVDYSYYVKRIKEKIKKFKNIN